MSISFAVDGLATSYDRVGLIAKFDGMDRAINGGEGYSKSTNENNHLAWAESYLLEAYLDMYEATGDDKYLVSFVRHADRVVAGTDIKRGINDYKGRSMVGWNAIKYSKNGERIVWLAHSGMITYPLVSFASLVKTYNLEDYFPKAQVYTEVAGAALASFDQNWVYESETGNGYYEFSADDPNSTNAPSPPMPLPFNHQLAAGRTFLLLYKLTGNNEYRKKAEALAKHFHSNLTESLGSYTWYYWYGKGFKRTKTFEDISHGAIDLDFARLAYRSEIVFNRDDMSKFLKTYKDKVRKNGRFADKVDGSGEDKYKAAIGRWLALNEFSCVPWTDFETLVSQGTLSGHPAVMLGVAKLIKDYDKCSKRPLLLKEKLNNGVVKEKF